MSEEIKKEEELVEVSEISKVDVDTTRTRYRFSRVLRL